MNKRGESEIGSTVTWFVAFTIIFMASLIFVGITFLISSYKEDSYVKVDQSQNLLEIQSRGLEILNSKVDNFKIKEILLEGDIGEQSIRKVDDKIIDITKNELLNNGFSFIYLAVYEKSNNKLVYSLYTDSNTIALPTPYLRSFAGQGGYSNCFLESSNNKASFELSSNRNVLVCGGRDE